MSFSLENFRLILRCSFLIITALILRSLVSALRMNPSYKMALFRSIVKEARQQQCNMSVYKELPSTKVLLVLSFL